MQFCLLSILNNTFFPFFKCGTNTLMYCPVCIGAIRKLQLIALAGCTQLCCSCLIRIITLSCGQILLNWMLFFFQALFAPALVCIGSRVYQPWICFALLFTTCRWKKKKSVRKVASVSFRCVAARPSVDGVCRLSTTSQYVSERGKTSECGGAVVWADVLICHELYVGIDDGYCNGLVIPLG